MDIQTWWVWMIIAAIFVIAEIFTAGFFILWFGIGAATAGVLAMIGLGYGWQWSGFIVVSGVLFALSRKFADRITVEQPPGIGADRFTGKIGIVIMEIRNENNSGRIRLGNEEWRAESETGEIIAKGEKVIANKIEGTRLIVARITKGE